MKRSRRHRNPSKNQEQSKEQPFFAKTQSPDVQSKEDPAFFQPKLRVGQPDDQYEREADSVAEKVVSQSADQPQVQPKKIQDIQRTTLATPVEDEKLSTAEQRMEKDKLIQEKPEIQAMEEEEEAVQMQEEEEEPIQMQEEEEEPIQMQEEEEEPIQMQEEEEEALQMQEKEEEPIQMQEEEEEALQMQEEEEEPIQMQEEEEEELMPKRDKGGPRQASNQLSQRVKAKSGRGQKLPDQVRAEMEGSFGRDFSKVHIHTDYESVSMNQELGAQAFTHGKDIYFNTGKFSPERVDGKRLLAHELTHVVQQGGGAIKRLPEQVIQRKKKKKVVHNKVEKKMKKLVAAGKHKKAVTYLMKQYGFVSPFLKVKIVDSLGGAYATTSGKIKAGAEQTITVPKTLFSEDFAFIVRTLGHEFQHVLQRSQKKPVKNQKEREFLAWSWEALDTSAPPYTLKTAAWHAKKALKYYEQMPAKLKKKHKDRKKKLDKLIKKAAAKK